VLVPGALMAQPPGDGQGDGRYMVQFRQAGPAEAAAIRSAGGTPIHQFPDLNVIAARLPNAALQALQRNPNVLSIEVDPRRYPSAQVTPYGITMVEADQVSSASAGNRKVCIIDSGYYRAHADLQTASVAASPNAGTGDPFTDRCGHGTHVAGTIAALNNTDGVVGVVGTGNLSLHIVKVFGDSCAWAYSSDLIAAATACESAGANVISMSLGGSFKNRFEEQKFNSLYNNGRLSVAAAGNNGSTSHSYPASYSSVISVAAIDSTKTVAAFSQKNNQVELAAPGVGVLSTVPWVGATVTGNSTTYRGSGIEGAATTNAAGRSGALVNGGLCTSAGAWTGAVVLCERGTNSFYEKVINAQNGGARAAVIYNNVSGGFAGTLGTGNTSAIPAVALSREDGMALASWNGTSTVVNSKDAGSGYEAWDGTSMATPHVAGVAALIWSQNPGLTNAQIRDALQKTAEDLGTAGRDNSYGYGLVRAKAALDYLTGGSPPPPPPPPPAAISLEVAQQYKVKGTNTVDLRWSGSTATSFDVKRSGMKIATVSATTFTDSIGKGAGSYTYQVCEAGSSTCSNTVTVTF
jgi:subtilisin family serine protease